MTTIDDRAAFRGTDAEYADLWVRDVHAPTGRTCWSCGREIHAYGYRVIGYERRRRWTRGSHVVCPPCYISSSQSSDLRRADGTPKPGHKEFGDGHVLNGQLPRPCEHCGLMVVVKPDPRREQHMCSEACRVAHYRDAQRLIAPARDDERPTCQGCGAEMDGRSDQRYCSGACRQRAYRRRQRT